MAIWNQNYDPRSYVTEGYKLPTREIMGAIGARTNYFLDSANKLANEYNNTFDFNISNDANKARLQQQKAEVDEKMKGLVKKDLTISDNSSAIRNLYKPIMQDQSYIMDEALTNKISSGFQQAQSDLKKNGADHYNMKSIQVMNETLNDWRKDDPSNIEKYTSDTLGTTYQPYDPKVDREFQKTIQDRVKSGKIKVDVKDGQGNIITQEYADLNSVQAQEYIREIRPQQQVVQDQLDAKLYGNRLRKSSPEERGQLLSSIKGIQKYNIDKQVAYIENERHKVEANYALKPKDEQENGKKAYKLQIEQFDDIKRRAQGMYDTFDDNAYFDPHKSNVSQNQLETVLNHRSINALVDGMGLESNSRTIKSDTSFWNAQTLAFNREKLNAENEYRKADLLMKAAKLKATKGTGENGENTNIQPASDVASVGTTNLDPERKAEIIGKELQTQLKGELETKKSGIASSLFSQLGVTVSQGIDNTDFFSALDKSDPNETLGGLMANITGGSQRNKDLIKILVNEGAKKLTNGKFYKESTLPNISLREAKMDIKAALENPEIFNSAIKKAGIDTGNFNAADYLGYQGAQIAYDEKTQAQKYTSSYEGALKAAGIQPKVDKNKPVEYFNKLKHYNEDAFIQDISPELIAKGYTTSDIKDFSNALKEGKNLKMGLVYEHGIPHLVNNGVNPRLADLVNYQERWNSYQKNLNSNLSKVVEGASNYNTTTYQITDKTPADKGFNPEVHYNKSSFQTLINNNASSVSSEGETKNAEFLKKVQQFVNTDKDIISGFAPYSDGATNFITLKINRSKDNDKLIKEAGLDPEELVNTKIYVDNTAIQNLGFKPQSKATHDLQTGRIFGASTPSGNSFSFYNVGSANDMKINYDGSILNPTYDENTGTFNIKHTTADSYIKGFKEDALQKAIAKGGADIVASNLYQADAEAKRISDVLNKYKINPEEVHIFAQLPKEAKEELKAKTITFKNRRD